MPKCFSRTPVRVASVAMIIRVVSLYRIMFGCVQYVRSTCLGPVTSTTQRATEPKIVWVHIITSNIWRRNVPNLAKIEGMSIDYVCPYS